MKERWVCGHISEGMCAACFLDLADKANGWRALADQYADTILKLRAEIRRLQEKVDERTVPDPAQGSRRA